MLTFRAGFDRTVITPPHGTNMRGYFFQRLSDGVLDDLELNTLAASDGEQTIIIMVADLCEIPQARADRYRHAIAQKAGIPYEAVFISCTHTHTGPDVGEDEIILTPWEQLLEEYIVSSAQRAFEDMIEAEMSIAHGLVERVAFIRRYRMKDGYVRTNPGVNNPDIVDTIGMPDETEQVVRIRRQDKHEIVLVQFQVHPDVVGGTKISADYPRFVRETVEQALENKVHCIYLNGACGDLNHVNTSPRPGERNGLEETSFDDCLRGYEYARNMGRAIAGEALKIYGKTADVSAVPIRFAQRTIQVPSNRPASADLQSAEHIADLHNTGRDAELPFKAMELTTAVAEALRMVKLKDGPDEFPLHITSVAIGEVAFLGIPGEPFTAMGRSIKEGSPFTMTLPSGLSNGSQAYFPLKEAYDEGGYEARSSSYASGIGEAIVEASIDLLKEIKTDN